MWNPVIQMPAWLITVFHHIFKTAPACAVGLLLIGGYGYWSIDTLQASQDSDRATNAKGLAMIMFRLDVLGSEDRLGEINSEIRDVEEQLRKQRELLAEIGSSSGAATVRDTIQKLTLDLEDIRMDENEERAELLDARRDLGRASTE